MMPVAMTRENSLERGSLGDLYVRHAPESIRLAFLLTGDRALAEDLVQEAFARLVGRLRHLRDPGAFGAYLRRTIVNLATSHFRHRLVERAHLERLAGTSAVETNPNEDLDETMHKPSCACPNASAPRWSCASTRTSRTSRRPRSSGVRRGPSAPSSRAA
jgi:DNA-directed RNA polymerase specialized sigma24 family protein